MLDTVFFELEGVLADTATARRDALLETLTRAGVALDDAEYRETCAGLGVEEAVRAAFRRHGAAEDDTAVALTALMAERAYRTHLGKGIMLVEGAREVVERMHAVARLALVTRASRAEAQFVLSLARLEHCFGCVVAAEDAPSPKPSPEPYRRAIARLRRSGPARGIAVAIEDALPGIRAARAAGLACVVVGDVPAHVALEADGYRPVLSGLGPDELLDLVAREPIA